MGPRSIARGMALVGVVALTLGAMRVATEPVADAYQVGVYAALVLASVAAAVRGRRSGAWAGFALAGWAYYLPLFAGPTAPDIVRRLPTSRLLVECVARVVRAPAVPPGVVMTRAEFSPQYDNVGMAKGGTIPEPLWDSIDLYNRRAAEAMRVGHLGLTLVLACLGSLVGSRLHAVPAAAGAARQEAGPLRRAGRLMR